MSSFPTSNPNVKAQLTGKAPLPVPAKTVSLPEFKKALTVKPPAPAAPTPFAEQVFPKDGNLFERTGNSIGRKIFDILTPVGERGGAIIRSAQTKSFTPFKESFTQQLNDQFRSEFRPLPRPLTKEEEKNLYEVMQGQALPLNEIVVQAVKNREGIKQATNIALITNLDAGLSPKKVEAKGPTVSSVNETGVKNIKLSEQGQKIVTDNIEAIKPELEKIKGGVLSNAEVKEAAKKSTILRKVISKEESLDNLAALQKTRENLGALAEGKGVSADFIEQLKIVKSQATDAARKLQAFGIETDPSLVNPKADLVNKLVNLGIHTDDIIKAAENVDFNNAKEAAKFYRKFVKPDTLELINEWRYGNMLSSPLTHVTNIVSNTLQAGILNPATKLASGIIDNVGSKLFGKEQTHFIREAPVAYKGMVNSIPTALSEAWKAFKGEVHVERVDFKRIPTGSKFTAVQRQFLQALEAGDAFFRTLIKSGDMESLAAKYSKMGKKFTPESLEQEAAKNAEYYVFRKGTDVTNKTGQGTFLSGIDKITAAVQQARDNKYVGWFVPFVQTPMNILKQGVEYSPAGILTLPGNADKIEQLGKTLIGTTVFAGAGFLAMNNRTTWGVPTNPQEKELFYAAGMQPYSVKIGDKWVSYSKLGPLSYPIAMAAAIKYYWQDNPKSIDQSSLNKTTQILAGIAKFFGDQSYVQGITDAIGAVQSTTRVENLLNSAENLVGQLIPLSSLQRWVNQIIDPVFRKPEKDIDIKSIIKSLQSNLIGQSDILEPYKTPKGDDSKRQYPVINSVNPMKMTKEDPNIVNELNLNRELQSIKILQTNLKDEAKARIEPIYNHVQELKAQNKSDEVQKIMDGLSDEDYEIYKSIKQSKTTAARNSIRPAMLEIYKKVQILKESGQTNEAQKIVDGLTEDEYAAYKAVKAMVNASQ